MRSFLKIVVLLLVIVVIVNIYRYGISVKEKKLSSEVINKKVIEKTGGILGKHKKVICPYCSGNRRVGSADSIKDCPVCLGRGYGIITYSGPDVFLCPDPPAGCGGMGYVLKNGKVRRCELCGGVGYGVKK